MWRATFNGRRFFLESVFLHLINLMRLLSSEDRSFMLAMAVNSVALDALINEVFRPQMLVPKSVTLGPGQVEIFVN